VSWELVVAATTTNTPVFRAAGDAEAMPQPVVWPAEGAELSDGRYRATLTARYEYGPLVEAATPEFRLDATAPEISVEVAPQPFSPDNDGTADVVTFAVAADDDSAIRYWVIEVFEPTGEFFYDIGGESAPPPRIVWDGVARNGERVLSAERYPWVLEIADELGNIARTEGALQVDVLLEAFGDGYRIQVPSITFAPNSADLELDPATDAGARNREVLDRVAEILRRFPDYRITVEGHAVNVSGTEREQRDELVPLSRRRAQSVRSALIDRGIPSAALDAVGRGGAAPIVPHGDTVNRWKNRRVDFLLQR
jgi:outer membrane protein OmpA-like peptidoglycan-associated protein